MLLAIEVMHSYWNKILVSRVAGYVGYAFKVEAINVLMCKGREKIKILYFVSFNLKIVHINLYDCLQ